MNYSAGRERGLKFFWTVDYLLVINDHSLTPIGSALKHTEKAIKFVAFVLQQIYITVYQLNFEIALILQICGREMRK